MLKENHKKNKTGFSLSFFTIINNRDGLMVQVDILKAQNPL